MNFTNEKRLLPAFPRTPHLPYKPNLEEDDLVAEESEVGSVFTLPVSIEEKIDGASVGMTLMEGNPIIRNRDHILRKGYVKETAAKKQFASIFNWFYENKEKFEHIAGLGPLSVYGEWCVAQHGIRYDILPDWFIAYDVYNYEHDKFVKPPLARQWLEEAGFSLPRLIFQGEFKDGYDELSAWANEKSFFCATEVKAEGIYLKNYDSEWITHRFKMVRPGFARGQWWNPKAVTKNKLAK